jgi:O-antigen/teichoic acid export membrane protein
MKIRDVVINNSASTLSYLHQGGFLKHAGKLVGATFISQVVLILSSLIITRLYTPEDFGILAIFTALVAQIIVCASFRYEWAIPLPEDEQVATDLLLLCLILTCSIAPLVAIGVIFSGHPIALWLNAPELEPYLWLLPIVILFGGWYQSLTYWSLRQKAFGLLAQTKIAQTFWTLGSQISIGSIAPGPLGLLVGATFNQVAGSGSQALFFWQHYRRQLQDFSVARIISIGHKYSKFATLSVGASIVEAANSVAPALLIAWLYDPQSAGLFALAQRVTSIPANLVGKSMSQVFTAHASALIRDDPPELKQLFNRTGIFLFAISLLISLGLFFSPWIFALAFGERWREAGIMAQYTIPMFVGSMTIGSLTILEWLDKQHWLIGWHSIRLILLCLGFWVAHTRHYSSVIAIAILSLIAALMYGILLFLNIYSINLLITNHSQALSKSKV